MAAPQPPLPRHGGDLAFATRLYGEPADGWLDLSTGISPFSYPVPPVPDDAYRRLPDADALAALLAAARAAYRVPDALEVVPVPGSESAIRLLPSVIAADRAAIVSPTYSSHAAAWPN
ncbi:MAG TPA: threonine-phosphate decarboxylase, partial [Bauldia sp.]|nr:threonine-phosphate decarboxylase [Bauldia sp.]